MIFYRNIFTNSVDCRHCTLVSVDKRQLYRDVQVSIFSDKKIVHVDISERRHTYAVGRLHYNGVFLLVLFQDELFQLFHGLKSTTGQLSDTVLFAEFTETVLVT